MKFVRNVQHVKEFFRLAFGSNRAFESPVGFLFRKFYVKLSTEISSSYKFSKSSDEKMIIFKVPRGKEITWFDYRQNN